MTAGEENQSARRSDPERRSRIIDACLEVISVEGVAGTSHRKVAAAADVPLGSMTYHFDGMDDLLRQAFIRFSERIAARFERRMSEASTLDEARSAVESIIVNDVSTDRFDLVLTHELYTLAARDAGFRDITNGWMARSRAALERHFDPETARMLDALIEGLTIHRALDNVRPDDSTVNEAVRRIVG